VLRKPNWGDSAVAARPGNGITSKFEWTAEKQKSTAAASRAGPHSGQVHRQMPERSQGPRSGHTLRPDALMASISFSKGAHTDA
jgi:hypothetical protein